MSLRSQTTFFTVYRWRYKNERPRICPFIKLFFGVTYLLSLLIILFSFTVQTMKFLFLLTFFPMVSSFSPSTNSRIKIMRQSSTSRVTLFSVPRVKAGFEENPEKTVLLDVRETDEWNQGHLSLANHSPLSQLSSGEWINEITGEVNQGSLPVDCCTGETICKDANIFIHCKLGGRAKKAAALLNQMGYKYVIPLEESFDQLVEAGICDVVVDSK